KRKKKSKKLYGRRRVGSRDTHQHHLKAYGPTTMDGPMFVPRSGEEARCVCAKKETDLSISFGFTNLEKTKA
ncbi:hypothetical protein HID58_046036, partial [Brassica napus]